MLFYFKYFDKTIFQFSLQNGDSDSICNIIKESINHENINHLPIEFCGELSEEHTVSANGRGVCAARANCSHPKNCHSSPPATSSNSRTSTL